MYPAKPGLIIGFHGCDQRLRDRLVSGKTHLKPSKNIYDWLGNGVYFWENNQQRALQFARELKKRKGVDSPIQTPSVIGAVIDLGFCLDLLDAEYIQLVEKSYRALAESCKTLGLDLPQNKTINGSSDLLLRNLDCAVIQHLHLDREKENMPAFDSVRGVFTEGRKLYKNAGFNKKNHIQMAIRNPNCIKGYFIPKRADNEWHVP